MSRKDDRPLRDDERQLWDVFSKSLKPLPKKPVVKAEQPATAPPLPPPKLRKKAPAAAPPPVPPKKPPPPPLSPLGRREKSRVARGKTEIEARLDLHGHTQAEAHAALLRFLRRSADAGKRLVLVITGKSGVLRQQVPHWLSLPEVRGLVLGVDPAAINHGGEGALYVRLKRAR